MNCLSLVKTKGSVARQQVDSLRRHGHLPRLKEIVNECVRWVLGGSGMSQLMNCVGQLRNFARHVGWHRLLFRDLQ